MLSTFGVFRAIVRIRNIVSHVSRLRSNMLNRFFGAFLEQETRMPRKFNNIPKMERRQTTQTPR